ncbi:MAG: hypothetical protein AAGJ35_15225, partial [Myxococcota bacterium]
MSFHWPRSQTPYLESSAGTVIPLRVSGFVPFLDTVLAAPPAAALPAPVDHDSSHPEHPPPLPPPEL